MTGTIELVAFPETYQTFQDAWEVDNVIEVEAKVDLRGEKAADLRARIRFDRRPRSKTQPAAGAYRAGERFVGRNARISTKCR
ncbi:MAG: hypothetical protein R2855_10800 [Thermomicrobiales bacterium]